MTAGSVQEIWEAALGELQIQVSKSNYKTWLEKTVGLDFQNDQFVVSVPNTFAAEYLDKNQRSLIEKTLISLTRRNIQVLFKIDNAHQDSLSNNGENPKITPVTPTSPSPFNPKYTFDSFIIGNCNRLAHAAAIGVAEKPGHIYNPLFICGGVGLGKTHLLHAIGYVASASNVRVLYVSAEQFTNEFVNAIRNKQTEFFRHKYRNVDMLLIDDIHFISGKEQTEESIFHTFNELHNANHQIVLTSDRPPKSMSLLKERLRSRFEWGLVADMKPPDFETRLAILRVKAEQKGIAITSDTLELIAQRSQQNIRELEGSLNRVIAFARLTRAEITPELTAEALEDIASKTPRGFSITPSLVVEAAACSFELTPIDLRSRKRDKETALARQVAMYVIKQEIKCSLTQIGKELGGRDPATVTYAYQKIANEINANSYLRDKISDIQRRIRPQVKAKKA